MTRPPTMQDMGWLLNNFANSVAGIAHVVAVSADGLLLASSQDLPTDRADQLAAITSGVVSLTDGASRMFDAGQVQQTIIEMDSGYLFLMSISDGSSMAVLAARSCDVGQVGYEMALLVERVGAVRREVTGGGQQQTVGGHGHDVRDPGHAVGEVAEQPAHVLHGGGPGHC